MPGETGEPVVTTLVWFYFFPREAAGASSTRHSPRPFSYGAKQFMHPSGADASRECGGVGVLFGEKVCAFTSPRLREEGEVARGEIADVSDGVSYPSPLWGRDERSSLLGKADRERSERCAGWGRSISCRIIATVENQSRAVPSISASSPPVE
jgi:hypothetical protein